MNEWWSLLTGLEKFYWISAISGTGIFLIQMILTFNGFHHDTDLAIDQVGQAGMTNADTKDKFQFFTVRNLVIFFATLGWVGNISLAEGFNPLESLLAGGLAGGAMMYGVAAMLKGILSLAIDKTTKIEDAMYQIGEVYLTIPAKESGIGKVNVIIKGTLRELDAKSVNKSLGAGTKVRVIDILENDVLLVDEVDDSE